MLIVPWHGPHAKAVSSAKHQKPLEQRVRRLLHNEALGFQRPWGVVFTSSPQQSLFKKVGLFYGFRKVRQRMLYTDQWENNCPHHLPHSSLHKHKNCLTVLNGHAQELDLSHIGYLLWPLLDKHQYGSVAFRCTCCPRKSSHRPVFKITPYSLNSELISEFALLKAVKMFC